MLDEPTSSLDNISEKEIISSILETNITCVLVSHRYSTIKNFKKIIVLDKGEIIESGSHKELINGKGVYYNIFNHENQ